MATVNIKQLESFDSGSNYKFEDKRIDQTTPRSVFDLSHKNIGTMPENGVIMPIALIPTVPNESDDISINILLRALPTVVPLESRQRLYIYAFYSRMGDLWNNWNTFMKKGYSGNVNKTVPTFHTPDASYIGLENRGELTRNKYWETKQAIQATSMGESMGLPHEYRKRTVNIDGIETEGWFNTSRFTKFIGKNDSGNKYNENISVLPFMMLLRIWRDYFTNKNYWIDDRVILPDDDEEFRLDDNGRLISATNNGKKLIFDINSKIRDLEYNDNSYTGTDKNTLYFGLPYHEYPKDRFTSALPFMQRGDTPTLEKEFNIGNEGGKLQLFNKDGSLKSASNAWWLTPTGNPNTNNQIPLVRFSNTETIINRGGFEFQNPTSTTIMEGDYLGVGSAGTAKITLSITMNELRKLAQEQTELEAMARTDGSYREFGLTFFGKVSKNATDHKPVYIGGMYQEIKYTEVVQTSADGETPLGSYTGHSTGMKTGYIGHIDTDDYGYIMILACVMPDVLYSEGLDKHWTNLHQSDFYLPTRAKLGMTPILKKEVRFNYDRDEEAENTNNNLFAYQNIYDELRYTPNRISGYIADAFRKEYFPYTQSRIIASTPIWGREFAMASKDNIRNDYLVAPNEPPFTFDCGISIRSVRPLPYKPIPANLTGL